jgi:branched-chain amino acid aminotransferase
MNNDVKSTHSYMEDSRNEDVLIYINGEYFKRSDAKISVFDSGFLLGDGVWEGIRYHKNTFIFLKQHLNRLYKGAKSLSIDIGLSQKKLGELLQDLMIKNNMSEDVHIRLIVSRGLKKTPYQHPNANILGSTIVAIPEYKKADKGVNEVGVTLATVNTIRSTDKILDPKINSLSKLNCILACIEADNLGVDEGLMLDINGFVSTCNSTNFFMIKDNEVFTSRGEYCLNGVTRGKVIEACESNGITINQVDFTLDAVHNADEAFVTGTFAGIIPVVRVDSNLLSSGKRGALTHRLQLLYQELISKEYSGN